ncbi:hypothetical protein C8R46DRAFT_1201920 [Mycena filopes]|nr:hypothetical protein C8R46DRAFT_1201920 [Mycena filopes]
MRGATSAASVSELWEPTSSVAPPSEECQWFFWQGLAAACLTETTISTLLNDNPVAELTRCLDEGLSVVEQLLVEWESSADSKFSAALCVRYLGGILDLPGFWVEMGAMQSLVAKKLCGGMVRALKDIGVDVLQLGFIDDDELPFDYDGLDFLAATILVALANWFKKVDDQERTNQLWYDPLRKLLQLLRAPRSADLLPQAFACAIDIWGALLPLRFQSAELDVTAICEEGDGPSVVDSNIPLTSVTGAIVEDNLNGDDESVQSNNAESAPNPVTPEEPGSANALEVNDGPIDELEIELTPDQVVQPEMQEHSADTQEDMAVGIDLTLDHPEHGETRKDFVDVGPLGKNIDITFTQTAILVLTMTFPPSPSPEQLSRTLTWLSRAKTCPLDILLDFRDRDWDWEDEETHGFRLADMEAVLDLLLPFAGRWQSFQLLTDTWAPIFTFLHRTQTLGPVLANLERLHLARCNAYFARKGQIFEPKALGQHLPLFGAKGKAVLRRLREVILTGVHVNWAAPSLANLTTLELKYHAADVMPTVPQFAHILARCPNLETLALVGLGSQFTTGEHATGPTITLPRVKHFTFGFVDVPQAMRLLALFALPALRELTLDDVAAALRCQPPEDAGRLLEWVMAPRESASGDAAFSGTFPLAQLQTLGLRSMHAPTAAFERLYDTCRGLQALRLWESGDTALEALENPGALPFLRTLFVRGPNEARFARVTHTRAPGLDASFEEYASAEDDED